jgi:hypothetical protein
MSHTGGGRRDHGSRQQIAFETLFDQANFAPPHNAGGGPIQIGNGTKQ